MEKRKRRPVFAIALIAAALLALCTFAACDTEETHYDAPVFSSAWSEVPENKNENLKYFGTFGGAGFWSQSSYLGEIAQNGNSNVVVLDEMYGETLKETLAEIEKNGMKAFVTFANFHTNGIIAHANTASLISKERYESAMDSLITAAHDYIEDGTVLGFYIDRPAYNGVKEEDFRAVSRTLRSKAPSLKLLVSHTVYDTGARVKGGYAKLSPAYSEFCTDVMYLLREEQSDVDRANGLAALKSIAADNQNIWSSAFTVTKEADFINGVERALKGAYTEAINEPRCVGILTFSYADGFETDYGYGLHSLLKPDSENYNRNLKKLYVNIGCAVTGKTHDFTVDREFTVNTQNKVYNLGDDIAFPDIKVRDGNGEEVDYEAKLFAPDGTEMPAYKPFTATMAGNYKLTVTSGEEKTHTAYISVRDDQQISTFDTQAYIDELGGNILYQTNDYEFPRTLSTDFYRSGTGSLKMLPYTSATWPILYFGETCDVSDAAYLSFWLYNTGRTVSGVENTNPLDEFEFRVGGVTVKNLPEIPVCEWTEVRITGEELARSGKDLTQAELQLMANYSVTPEKNVFYIDDFYVQRHKITAADSRVCRKGATVSLPEPKIVRYDGDAADITCKISMKVKSPSGKVVEVSDNKFTASEEGVYTIEYTAENAPTVLPIENATSKIITGLKDNEINSFDSADYLGSLSYNKKYQSDANQWQGSFESEIKHGGDGALKLMTDEGWPEVTFLGANADGTWNLTNVAKISFWIYNSGIDYNGNPVNNPLKDFQLRLNGDNVKGVEDIPADGKWHKVECTLPTKHKTDNVKILLMGNLGATGATNTVYIDDVTVEYDIPTVKNAVEKMFAQNATVTLPELTGYVAAAGGGTINLAACEYSVKNPSGNDVELQENQFSLTEKGTYSVTVKTADGITVATYYAVTLKDGEINSFGTPAHINKIVCTGWSEIDSNPETTKIEYDTGFKREGEVASARISAAASWKRLRFCHADGDTWNFTNVSKVSFWIYITGNNVFNNLQLQIGNLATAGQYQEFAIGTVQNGEWRKVTVDVSSLSFSDKTALQIALSWNFGADTFAPFYLDDMVIEYAQAE